ncbi:hypothetical protein [Pontibacter sp. G13]|uniref:hypothetical protein n=1 Tax=Pontibacter sp. G13 TaxID=3074898 RepID=UPI00288B64C7|nr:hypothetical protein [Pontibacter sp. G13]WNJ20146.1 hypothetical protein RJD25_06650 [Pontibacter sp. G13]
MNLHYQLNVEVIDGNQSIYAMSPELMALSYLSTHFSSNGGISIDYAGYIKLDQAALEGWKNWYLRNQCTISWKDLVWVFDFFEDPNWIYQYEAGMNSIDSILLH